MKKARFGIHAALLALPALLLCVAPAYAGKHETSLNGSIRVEGRHSKAELEGMAKISMKQSDDLALAAVEGSSSDKSIVEHELEVEGGSLLYSVEIKVRGKSGVEEILIDAGDGKVLGREQEKK